MFAPSAFLAGSHFKFCRFKGSIVDVLCACAYKFCKILENRSTTCRNVVIGVSCCAVRCQGKATTLLRARERKWRSRRCGVRCHGMLLLAGCWLGGVGGSPQRRYGPCVAVVLWCHPGAVLCMCNSPQTELFRP